MEERGSAGGVGQLGEKWDGRKASLCLEVVHQNLGRRLLVLENIDF